MDLPVRSPIAGWELSGTEVEDTVVALVVVATPESRQSERELAGRHKTGGGRCLGLKAGPRLRTDGRHRVLSLKTLFVGTLNGWMSFGADFPDQLVAPIFGRIAGDGRHTDSSLSVKLLAAQRPLLATESLEQSFCCTV